MTEDVDPLRDPATRDVVLRVLQESRLGFARYHGRSSADTGLPAWKRLFNTVARALGAEQAPFVDPLNWSRVEALPLEAVADPVRVDEAMRLLAPIPTCRVCGSTNLEPDPAGYYCDAETYWGAPLLCLDHG